MVIVVVVDIVVYVVGSVCSIGGVGVVVMLIGLNVFLVMERGIKLYIKCLKFWFCYLI